MSNMTHKILAADYHRNGVGGVGFYVAIVESTNAGEFEAERFLVVDFSGDMDDKSHDPGLIAVLRVSDVTKGNIGMFPLYHPESGELIEGTGGAAWRGADHWGWELRAPIRDWHRRSHEAAMRTRREGVDR